MAAVSALLALAAASCGGDDDPYRLAVQVDCEGGFSSWADISLAGAFLPLLERGAHLAGASPSGGVSGVRLAGEPVDVSVACTESAESTVSVPMLRRLLEEEQPDAVVTGGVVGQDGLVVRDIAKHYPDVTFFVTVPAAQEITLAEPAPNVFRVGHDNAQTVAGLATYAYRELGWRRAAVVASSYPDDWEATAGFISEFCALGGTATRDDGRAWADPAGTAARYDGAVDGVAVLPSWVPPTPFLGAMAKRHGAAVGSRLVLGGWAFATPSNLVVPGADVSGVVVATALPRDAGTAAWRRYVASFRKTYPRFPADTAAGALVVPYRNAVEAFVAAFEETGGDPGEGGTRLRKALASMALPSVPDETALDRNRQGIVTVYLSRVGSPRRAGERVRTVEVVRGVDQAYGGIFASSRGAPTAGGPPCDHAVTPPSWAR